MILGIDSSGPELLVALVRDGAVVATASGPAGRHQASIGEAIRSLTEPHGGLAAVGALAVAVGPGSHTGLRVGLSTASGIAYGRRLAVYPLSSMAVAAYRGGAAERVLAAVGAGRGRAFAQEFVRAGGAKVPAGRRMLVEVSALAGLAGDTPLAAAQDVLDAVAPPSGTPVRPGTLSGPGALAEATLAAFNSGHPLHYDQLTGEYGDT